MCCKDTTYKLNVNMVMFGININIKATETRQGLYIRSFNQD